MNYKIQVMDLIKTTNNLTAMRRTSTQQKEACVIAILNALVDLGGNASTDEIREWVKRNDPSCLGVIRYARLDEAQKILMDTGCVTIDESQLKLTDKGIAGLTMDEVVSLVAPYEIATAAEIERQRSARQEALDCENFRIRREKDETRFAEILRRQREIQNYRSEHSVWAALKDSICAFAGHSCPTIYRGLTDKSVYGRCSRCHRLFYEVQIGDGRWYWREVIVAPKSEDNGPSE